MLWAKCISTRLRETECGGCTDMCISRVTEAYARAQATIRGSQRRLHAPMQLVDALSIKQHTIWCTDKCIGRVTEAYARAQATIRGSQKRLYASMQLVDAFSIKQHTIWCTDMCIGGVTEASNTLQIASNMLQICFRPTAEQGAGPRRRPGPRNEDAGGRGMRGRCLSTDRPLG